jgi:hypothetical protein
MIGGFIFGMATDTIGGFYRRMIKGGLFPIGCVMTQRTLPIKMIGGFIRSMAACAITGIGRGMIEV